MENNFTIILDEGENGLKKKKRKVTVKGDQPSYRKFYRGKINISSPKVGVKILRF